jgi:hypothetical protein
VVKASWGEGFSALDPPSSSLVVLVRAVGENSDEHALFAVPDSERFALVFEDLLGPSASPGPLLASLVADRGPEAGDPVPRGFPARDHRPRDAAVLKRVAQCSTLRWRPADSLYAWAMSPTA